MNWRDSKHKCTEGIEVREGSEGRGAQREGCTSDGGWGVQGVDGEAVSAQGVWEGSLSGG